MGPYTAPLWTQRAIAPGDSVLRLRVVAVFAALRAKSVRRGMPLPGLAEIPVGLLHPNGAPHDSGGPKQAVGCDLGRISGVSCTLSKQKGYSPVFLHPNETKGVLPCVWEVPLHSDLGQARQKA